LTGFTFPPSGSQSRRRPSLRAGSGAGSPRPRCG
jgi:hypothetical protein